MPTPPDSLPDDASALKALLVAAQAENERLIASSVRIPTQSGHRFRFEAGHRSDLKPATIPK
jgi:hypothetical protein